MAEVEVDPIAEASHIPDPHGDHWVPFGILEADLIALNSVPAELTTTAFFASPAGCDVRPSFYCAITTQLRRFLCD